MRWGQAEPFGAEYIDGPNLYLTEGGNPINRVDPTGAQSLTAKMLEILAWRYGRAVAIAGIGILVNWGEYLFGADNYTLTDDENEMNPGLASQMQVYYRYLVQHVYETEITEEWKTFTVPLDSAKAKVGQFTHPNFLLNGAHDVLASGTFEARVKNCHVYMRNIDMEWQWKDQIDANSFKESLERGNFKKMNPIGVLIEGWWDFTAEKQAAVDFFVNIKWKSFRWNDDPEGQLIAATLFDVESTKK
jgi:hypothetical protein